MPLSETNRSDPQPIPDEADRCALTSLLSSELERLGTEGQSFWTFIASLIGSLIVAAGGFLALDARDKPPERVDDWIWGLSAAIPLMIVAYAVTQMTKAVARNYYGRHIERHIYRLNKPTIDYYTERVLPPTPATDTISAAMESNTRGLLQVRFIVFFEYVTISATLTVACALSLERMDGWASRILFACAYLGIAVATLSLAHSAGVKGKALWGRLETQVARDLQGKASAHRVKSERRLISYLAIPRPNDLLVKAVGLHATSVVIGRLLVPNGVTFATAFRTGAIVLLCFEFLVYQSRYMINDWTGRKSDQIHQYASERGRVPRLDDSSVRPALFWVAFVVRLTSGLMLPFILLERDQAEVLTAGSLGIWLLAAGYEYSRRRTASDESAGFSLTVPITGVYILVGLSYGGRAALGIWFGSSGAANVSALLMTGLAFYFYGLAIVLMSWVLEGLTFLPSPGKDLPSPHPDEHPPSSVYLNGLTAGKKHLGPLMAWAGFVTADAHPVPNLSSPDLGRYPGLKNSRQLSLPWNWLIVASGALVAALGWTMRSGLPSTIDGWAVVAGLLGGIVMVAVVRWAAYAVALPLAAAVFVLVTSLSGEYLIGLTVVPLALIALIYAITRGLTYEKMITMPAQVVRAPQLMSQSLAHVARELIR